LKKILAETHGIIVFQEHVLEIANLLAGYSLGKADLLRKAMGKKDSALMAAQKREFLAGADGIGIDREVSEDIFNQIETFARYGFNRAHSTCYAYIAYQTAWLKCHYPKEFLAALMTSEINDSDRIYRLLEEARRMGIHLLPPDTNESMLDFSVVGENIRFGLQAVKNVGEGPARAIAEERIENGIYKSLADLVGRIPPGTMNRRTLESLIAAGACDSLEGSRAQKFATVEAMLEYGHKVFENENTRDLFAGAGGVVERVAPRLPDGPDWSNAVKLEKEREMLGFYISGHPLDKYRDELECFATTKTAEVGESIDGQEVTIGGMVKAVKRMIDRKGNMMAFATIEDFTGALDIIIFSKTYEQVKEYVQTDRMVLVTGRVSTREGKAANVLVNEVIPLENLAERFNCQLVIKLDADCSEATTDTALTLLEAYSGPAPVLLAARENGKEVYIKSNKYAVSVNFELLNRLKELLGDSAAYLRPLEAKNHFQ
jgi:DNA polymerase-3 subunit alpha